jgi:hypothetical protein
MALFFICVDSPEDEQQYSDLLTHLDLLGAKRVLSSVWALKIKGHTPLSLADLLTAYLSLLILVDCSLLKLE